MNHFTNIAGKFLIIVLSSIFLLNDGELLFAQSITADATILSFGKERSVRASSPFVPSPATTTVTASVPIIWQQPSTGNYYASVSTGPIIMGQLLTADLLSLYGAQTSIIYEAPNHPYIIQSISQGGTVNLGGTIPGSNTPISTQVEYGRQKIGIAVGTPDGKITLGVPVPITFTIPPLFTGANELRIDFGTTVTANGRTDRIIPFTSPPNSMIVPVIYSAEASSGVSISAVATTGSFIDRSLLSINGYGLQATGAVISGLNSFQTVTRSGATGRGSMTITVIPNIRLVRRNGNVTYRYTVTNTSAIEIRNVSIWDNHFSTIAENLTLTAFGTIVREGTFTLTSTTKNSATATGKDVFDNTISEQSDRIEVTVIDPSIKINVWAKPIESKRNKAVEYHYDISNDGDVTLTNLSVTDDMFGAIEGRASLDAWKDWKITRRFTVPDIPENTFKNIGTVTAGVENNPGAAVTNQDGETITLVRSDMQLTCKVEPDKVKANTRVKFIYTVSNTGNTLLNVDLIDQTTGMSIEKIQGMNPNDTRSIIKEELITTTTHNVTAVAIDPWSDQISKTCVATSHVIYPEIKATIRANGSATSTTVSKGDKVNFDFTVTNTGDCDLTNVHVEFEGSEIVTYDLIPAKSTVTPKSIEKTFDQSTVVSIHCRGKDPFGGTSTGRDIVEVKVTEGLVSSMLNKYLGDARSLINQITVCSTKIVSVRNEFVTRINQIRGSGSDPCTDNQLISLLQEASALYNCVKDNIDAVSKLYNANIKTAAEVASGKVKVEDIITFLFTAGGELANTKSRLDAIKSEWMISKCGSTESKKNLVTVTISVQDEKGAPINNAAITCNGKTCTSGGSGSCSITLGLNPEDNVEANASTTIAGVVSVSGKNAVTYKSGDQLSIPVTINTSTKRSVIIKGQVVDNKGTPIVGASVIPSGAGVSGASTTAGGNGEYDLDVTAEIGKTISITGTVKYVSGGTSKPASVSVLFNGESSISAPVITLTSAEVAEKFTITGMVTDINGGGLGGVVVTADNGMTKTTGGDGSFSIGEFTGATGQIVNLTITMTDKNGKPYSKNVSVTFQGGKSVSAGTISFGELVKLVKITVQGKVTDSKGNALSGVSVSASGTSAVTTDGAGEFTGLGPIEVKTNEQSTVTATVIRTDGKSSSGSSNVSSLNDATLYTTIIITDVVVQVDFVVTGRVVDSQGNAIAGASVAVGSGWSGTSAADGSFTSSALKEKVGTVLNITASTVASDKKTYSGSASVTYSGGASIDAGAISISGVHTFDPNKKVKALNITPSNIEVAAGSTTTFNAQATFEDNSVGDATGVVTWSGGTKNTFVAGASGSFTMTAALGDQTASASITVKQCDKGKVWSDKLQKCINLDDAIGNTKDPSSDPCDKDEIKKFGLTIESNLIQAGSIEFGFDRKYNSFIKLINDKNSKPCQNTLLGAAYVGCEKDMVEFEKILDLTKEAVTQLMYFSSICPDLVNLSVRKILSTTIVQKLQEFGEQHGSMKKQMADMNKQLAVNSCDPNDVRNLGNTISDNRGDPNIPGSGGNGAQEICGDGIDNDGDGLIDEGCAGQTNANVTIYVFDSGSAKDDVFSLEVSGQGNLGNTPKGGARTYSLTLGAGSYKAFVTIIEAPDNIGTFTITIAQGSKVIASQSGGPAVGARVPVPFTIGASAFTGDLDSAPPMIDFDQVIQQESGKSTR